VDSDDPMEISLIGLLAGDDDEGGVVLAIGVVGGVTDFYNVSANHCRWLYEQLGAFCG